MCFFRFSSVSDETLFHSRSELEKLKYNKYLKLNTYVVDVKGFYPYINELRENIFKFKECFLEEEISDCLSIPCI